MGGAYSWHGASDELHPECGLHGAELLQVLRLFAALHLPADCLRSFFECEADTGMGHVRGCCGHTDFIFGIFPAAVVCGMAQHPCASVLSGTV